MCSDTEIHFTRRDIATYVADQDGGAHVDPELDESYATLTKMNSLLPFLQVVLRIEKRTLYIDEYKNGSKVEYVGP